MIKEPVRIRFKKLKNGMQSIYLDIYVNGMRRYEFLKLYIKPGVSRDIKTDNANTLKLANAIKAKRIVEIQNRRYGFSNISELSKADILEYMVKRAEKSIGPGQGKNRGIVGTAMRSAELVREYAKRKEVPFNIVDKEFVAGFAKFLKNKESRYGTTLKANSAYNLFGSFVAALNAAVRDEIIEVNPASKLSPSEKLEKGKSSRGYLTVDELRKLYETDYSPSPYTRRIFLFACMCGLRYSDIMELRWRKLNFLPNGRVTLTFRQIKTKVEITIPLSKEAVALLPERTNQHNDDLVFGYNICARSVNYHLIKWAKLAGITKHVSFHLSRHTYATMLLSVGADLYTVSKLLGHTNIKTTQLYAEVINQKKQEAVDLIPSFHK